MIPPALKPDELTKLILLVQFSATWTMVGLIWFVQLVHYPLFLLAGSSEFKHYHQEHTSRTQWVVGPPMLAELLSATAIFFLKPALVPRWGVTTGSLLLAVIWGSTALVQIPLHNRLANSLERSVCGKLVSTNWLRTIAWSLRGLLTAWMAWKVIP